MGKTLRQRIFYHLFSISTSIHVYNKNIYIYNRAILEGLKSRSTRDGENKQWQCEIQASYFKNS